MKELNASVQNDEPPRKKFIKKTWGFPRVLGFLGKTYRRAAALIPAEILIEIPQMKYLCSLLVLDGQLLDERKKFILEQKKTISART